MASPGTVCASPGCEKVVSTNLACPKCVQLGLPAPYFCNQDCFKSNYGSHKQVHSLAKQIIAAQGYVLSGLVYYRSY
jgi:methionyl aminopeptidase